MFLNSRSRVSFYVDCDWEKSRRRWDAARLSISNGAWRQHGLESLPPVLHIADRGTCPEQHSGSLFYPNCCGIWKPGLWNMSASTNKSLFSLHVCDLVYEYWVLKTPSRSLLIRTLYYKFRTQVYPSLLIMLPPYVTFIPQSFCESRSPDDLNTPTVMKLPRNRILLEKPAVQSINLSRNSLPFEGWLLSSEEPGTELSPSHII
jgi:hypothetical protein